MALDDPHDDDRGAERERKAAGQPAIDPKEASLIQDNAVLASGALGRQGG
jgi:hypothetical protein